MSLPGPGVRRECTDRLDHAVEHADVGRSARAAGPVDHHGVADQKVKIRHGPALELRRQPESKS